MIRVMDFVKLFDPTGFAKANVTKAAADYEKVSCLVAMLTALDPGLSMMKRAVQLGTFGGLFWACLNHWLMEHLGVPFATSLPFWESLSTRSFF